ncbi:TPA: hypothetical protein ACRMMF_006453, partial [Pseudomonas aeruginosa]
DEQTVLATTGPANQPTGGSSFLPEPKAAAAFGAFLLPCTASARATALCHTNRRPTCPPTLRSDSLRTASAPNFKAIGNSMAVPCVAWLVQCLHKTGSSASD